MKIRGCTLSGGIEEEEEEEEQLVEQGLLVPAILFIILIILLRQATKAPLSTVKFVVSRIIIIIDTMRAGDE